MLYLHILIVAIYAIVSVLLWRGYRRNDEITAFNLKTARDNAIIRDGLREFNKDLQAQIDRNEKLVAETKKKIAAASAAVKRVSGADPDAMGFADGMLPFNEDAPLMASVLTALVVKYGDLHLSMDDMKNVTDDDYVSVYVDTTKQELVLSSDPEKASSAQFFNFAGGDDETYH